MRKMKQSTLKPFLSLPSSSESDEESAYAPSPQKSALKLPEMWTRVRSRDTLSHQRITVFDIDNDLDKDKVLKRVREGAVREQGSFLFDPDEWKGRDDELTIKKSELSEDQLRDYARIATEVRQNFMGRAEAGSEESKG